MHQATLKVAGGKLLRIKIEGETAIQTISITGDFFLHPEDVLPEVEKALAGLPWPAEEDVYLEAVQKVLDEKKASFVGVSAHDIAQAILMARQSA